MARCRRSRPLPALRLGATRAGLRHGQRRRNGRRDLLRHDHRTSSRPSHGRYGALEAAPGRRACRAGGRKRPRRRATTQETRASRASPCGRGAGRRGARRRRGRTSRTSAEARRSAPIEVATTSAVAGAARTALQSQPYVRSVFATMGSSVGRPVTASAMLAPTTFTAAPTSLGAERHGGEGLAVAPAVPEASRRNPRKKRRNTAPPSTRHARVRTASRPSVSAAAIAAAGRSGPIPAAKRFRPPTYAPAPVHPCAASSWSAAHSGSLCH